MTTRMGGMDDQTSADACGCAGNCGISRRRFLKLSGVGMVAASGGSLPVLAGPFAAADTTQGHLVPADKRLDPAWVRGLFERGEKEIFRGKALDTIGMPCSGIGSGQLYLCGDGTLGSWQIFNNAASNWVGDTHSTYRHVGIDKPVDQGFAVAVAGDGEQPVTRTLSRQGFDDIEFQGEYPIGTVRYRGQAFPVRVELEAFSPFIPLNAEDSGLPVTVFHVTIENTSKKTVTAQVLSWLENNVCYAHNAQFGGLRRTRVVHENGRSTVIHSAEEEPRPDTPPKAVRKGILFEDFEGKDYGKWKAEGEAFGEEPARGTLANQQEVGGFTGKGLVNTFLGGDAPHGKLTSPEFRVKRKWINFRVGGGGHADKTCINLVIDGAVVRTAMGRNKERLVWRSWDVTELEGKRARLEIVDADSAAWGHVNIDHIEFADEQQQNQLAPMSEAPDSGTMALACLESDVNSTALPLPDRPLGQCIFDGNQAYPGTETRLGLVQAKGAVLKPGDKHTATFVLGWHFPNRPGGHAYAARFADAAEAVEYVLDNHDRLTSDTRLWRDTYYDSSLPFWLLDRLHSTMSYLATGTCQWWKNGRFWAYEGVACCFGTCTHVWNYAHGHARLFPELARSVREMQDFHPYEDGGGYHPDTGLVGYRSNDDYAADGQCGTILKAYREHLTSADNAFLERNWPRIKKALEHSIAQDAAGSEGGLSSDADGLIGNQQHNTYDASYHGANTFVGSLYLAALRAGETMAREVGDTAFAEQAAALFESGRKLTLERLWNGEYFVQEVDLETYPKHQYKNGCLSDHLFGQGWAHQVGLGYIYPEDRVKSAVRAVWKYNWAPDIAPYNEAHPPFRWFVTPGQAGLFTCTWPQGGYMPEGTVYKNEVWTGIEYQVAGHMMWEGFVEEALAICRAVHDRYRPEFFNPYNEVECGDHYARALASWGVYLALAGFAYHGPKGHIGFAPRITPERFRAAFTAAEGWGTFSQVRERDRQLETIEIHWGRLRLRTLQFAVPEGLGKTAKVKLGGKSLDASHTLKDRGVLISLANDIVIEPGTNLDIRIG